jgi:hypothetical protein
MTSIRTTTTVLLVALCLVAAGQASDGMAATYYVSPSGNDAGAGSSGDPWRTLQKAANTLQPGDEVRVADGNYAGFYTTRNGTAVAPIVFRAEGSHVVLDADNSSTPDIINVEGHDYTQIIGFYVEGGSRAGIRVVEATGCIVRDCVAGPNQKWGIFTAFTPQIQIIDNVCFASNEQHGIYVSNSRTADDNQVIRGNECFGNGQNGIQLNGDCFSGGDGIISGALIEDNFVHDNNWKGFSLISVRNSIIQNNVVCNNGVAGAGAGGIHLADEPGCDNPSNNNLVVNNTIIEFGIVCMRLNNNAAGNTVFNNLTVSRDLSRTIVDEDGGNAIDSASNLRLTSTAGLFVDESSNDYHLAPASAAGNAGTGSFDGRNAPARDFEGDARPSGGGYEVGADEYAGGGGSDVTAPSVALTAPSDGAAVSGTIAVSADASDNVQVEGVQFTVGGVDLGAEDLTVPYQVAFNTTAVSDGPAVLAARARDAAGNSASSAPVTVTVSNGPSQGGILPTHPRLAPTSAHLSMLRAKACYDNNGNPLGGCSPTGDWNAFVAWLDDGSAYYKPTASEYLLAYLVTLDQTYAQRAISDADATIADMSEERSDSFLYVYKYVKSVAMVYDILYDQLSSSKRTAYINYMNQVMTELWNHDNNPYYTWTGWGTNMPGNNYYYSFMLATACAGLALYNENPSPPSLPFDGTTYNDIYEFFQAKVNDQMIPQLNSYGEGGGWHEGVNYRLGSYMHMFEMFKLLRDAGGPDLFRDINFARQSLYYQLYILQPGNGYLYPGGDLARESSMAVCPYDRVVMLLLADGLRGDIESQYAQYWLDNVFTSMPSGWRFLFGSEFELYQNVPGRNFSELPLGYLAKGLDFVNSRSSWSSDAVSASFISADRIESHQHYDQNSFVIYKNGWQAPDAVTYSHTGIIQGTDTHNTILVDGWGQRFGEGTGNIIKYELTGEYSYAVGDAHDAYYGGEYGRKDMGDPPLLTHFDREFVHALPDFVVVFDRITPVNPNSEIKYLIHSHSRPSVQGAMITSSEGGGKLFHKTLLPANATFNVVSENHGLDGALSSYRVEIEPPSPTANHLQLNVMYTGSSSASSMPVTELFTTTSDNMVGTKFDAGGSDAIFLFSKDPAGSPPQGSVIYQIGRAGWTDHYLLDLLPMTPYHVETLVNGETLTVVVNEGRGPVTSSQGILHFTTGGSTVDIAEKRRDR